MSTVTVRFPHSSLVVLGATYILIARGVSERGGSTAQTKDGLVQTDPDLVKGAYCQDDEREPSDTFTLTVVPGVIPPANGQRQISRKGIRGITFGSLFLALSLMVPRQSSSSFKLDAFLGISFPFIGLCIGILGGAVSMFAGVMVCLGQWVWAEEHLKDVLATHRAWLTKVLQRYGLDEEESGRIAREVQALVYAEKGVVRFQTDYGVLVTERKGDGYVVRLERSERVVVDHEKERGVEDVEGFAEKRGREEEEKEVLARAEVLRDSSVSTVALTAQAVPGRSWVDQVAEVVSDDWLSVLDQYR